MAPRAQGRQPGGSGGPPLSPWLSLAGAAHAALLLAALLARPAPAGRAPAGAIRDAALLELIDVEAPGAALASGVGGARTGRDGPDGAPPPEAAAPGREGRAAPERPPDEPARALAHVGRAAVERAAVERAAVERALPGGDAPEPAPPVAGDPEGAEPGAADGAPGAADGAPGPAGVGRRLSLQELGVDRGSNPFLGSPAELPTERQLYNQRLRRSLRSEIAKQDRARGLGPEGPVVAAVTDLVMASASAPNTTALLRVRTDGAGEVTLVDVLEADRDPVEWQRIASQLVRALAGKRLRVPPGGGGVSFQLRVVSRVQLPSGADPGLGVDLLGIPLKKGDGDRSTKLSILSPIVKEVEVPDSDGLRVPVVAFSLLGLMGDPTDIGAVARRLVTAYLVAMDSHDRLEPSPAPSPAPRGAP